MSPLRWDVSIIAANLARNFGFVVFPCDAHNHPMLKVWPGRASTDAVAISRLWHEHPGPLIGIATGKRSGVSALDLDPEDPGAFLGWQDSHRRECPCAAYTRATRSSLVVPT